MNIEAREKHRLRSRRYREENLEKEKERLRLYYLENRSKILAQQKIYQGRHLEKNREKCRLWRKKSRGLLNARDAKRRSQEEQRTPPWLTKEDHREMKKIYDAAHALALHVDHEPPKFGKFRIEGRMKETVSGLHVPQNLRPCPALVNLSKGCKFDPETQGQDVHKHLVGKRWEDL